MRKFTVTFKTFFAIFIQLVFMITLHYFPILSLQAGAQPVSLMKEIGKIELYLFEFVGCKECHDLTGTLKKLYPFLEIRTFNINDPNHCEALIRLERRLGRRAEEFPVVIIGDNLLSGEEEIMKKLDFLLLEYQLKGGTPPPPREVHYLLQGKD